MEEEQLEFPKTAAEKKMHLHLSNGSQQSRRRLAWQHLGAFLHVRNSTKYDIIDVFLAGIIKRLFQQIT